MSDPDIIDVAVNSSEYYTPTAGEKIGDAVSAAKDSAGKAWQSVKNTVGNARESAQEAAKAANAPGNQTVDAVVLEGGRSGALAVTSSPAKEGFFSAAKEHVSNAGQAIKTNWDKLPPAGQAAVVIVGTLGTIAVGNEVRKKIQGTEKTSHQQETPANDGRRTDWRQRIEAQRQQPALAAGHGM